MKFLTTLTFLLLFTFTSAHALSVATWNVQKGKNYQQILEQMRGKLGQSDIILFQEIKKYQGVYQPKLLGEKFGYHYTTRSSDAILSKYPIRDWGFVDINPKTGRDCIYADIDVNGTLIRVYGPHLSFKVKKNPFISRIRKMEMNNILKHAKDFPGPVIVGGDLNTLGVLLAFKQIEGSIRLLKKNGFKNLLKKCRSNTQWAGGFLPMGRIDWIFAKGVRPKGCISGEFAGSDHRWLLGKFSISKQER